MNHLLDVDISPDLRTHDASAPRRSQKRRRLNVNITLLERAGRALVGAIGAVGGTLLLVSASGALAIVLEGLLVLAGLDLVITGALGHCPLYRKLGYVPPSLRGPA